MIKVEVTRLAKSYNLGVGGIGNVDWEIKLECGHVIVISTTNLAKAPFQDSFPCKACEKMAIQDLENFHITEEKVMSYSDFIKERK